MTSSKKRFALFTNGSFLSRATLTALRDQNHPPELIVLPDYPPAVAIPDKTFGQIDGQGQNPFLELVQDIPVAHVPRSRQHEIGTLLHQHDIDLMLVTCWPYLIDTSIIDGLNGAALNLHPSLLPAFRGPDPIGEQLESDDRRFGVSLHRLSNAFDRGDLVAQAEIKSTKKSPDRQTVEQDCANGGVQLFVSLLDKNPASWPCWPQQD